MAFKQSGIHCLRRLIQSLGTTEVFNCLEISTCEPLKYIMNNTILVVYICLGKSIRIQRVEMLNGISHEHIPKASFKRPCSGEDPGYLERGLICIEVRYADFTSFFLNFL